MRALTRPGLITSRGPMGVRRVSALSAAEQHNLTRLASLFSAEELALRQRRAALKGRVASEKVRILQPERCTPGALVPVNYLTGTNAVTLWEPFFAELYDTFLQSSASLSSTSPSDARPTVPLYLCPFCASKAPAHDEATASLRWRTPFDMRSHISGCHASEGVCPVELRAYNERVIGDISSCVLDRQRCARHNPFRAIVLVDTANMELGCPDVFLNLVRGVIAQSVHTPSPDPSSSGPARKRNKPRSGHGASLFSMFPIAFCCVQELFIPHTAKTVHAVYQLAQAHPDSDFFTIYAPNRLEAGDLTTAWAISALHDTFYEAGPDAATHRCPPVVVLTMDTQQKTCMQQLFGEGIATLGVSDNAVLCPRFVNAASILHTLREAIDGAAEL